MSLTPLEQEIVNIGNLVLQTVGSLVASKNPAYASLISLGTSLANEVTTNVVPGATSTSSNVPTEVAAAVQPVTSALSTIKSGASSATVKAGAVQAVVSEVVTIGEDIFHIFKPAVVVTPVPAAAS